MVLERGGQFYFLSKAQNDTNLLLFKDSLLKVQLGSDVGSTVFTAESSASFLLNRVSTLQTSVL